jgi:hypothetical protein|nr:MAG TPA: hypothetical protein [Caudoviricetes sp.]
MERELQGSVFLLQEEVHGEADAASPYDADNGQRKCKGGHRTVNTYAEMKKRHQEEVNALPIYWAFTEERFDEILKELGLTKNDTDKLCNTFGGGFCLTKDAQMIADTLARNFKEVEDAIQADETGDGFIKDMFLYELRNHEYTYTCEVEETVEACGFTMEQIENDERLRHGLEVAAKELREAAGFSF